MEAIKRQIFVLRNTLKDPIDYTSGTDMVPIEYHVMDFNIPATAVAVVYVLRSDGKLDKTLADVMDNVISFCPTKGFFTEGSNAIRVRVVDNNKSLVSFTEIVRVGKSMRFDDDAEAQQKMLIEQLLTKIGKLQGDIISGITTEKEERKEEISVERRRIDNLIKTNVLQTEVKLYSGVLQKGEIILSEPITNFEYLNLDLKYNGIHEISSVRVEDIKDGEESFGIRRLNVWNDPDPETTHGANLLEAPMWMKDTTNKTIIVSYVKDEGLLPSQSDALLKSTRSQLEMMLSIYGVKKIKDTELTDLRVLWDGSKAPTARAAMQLQFSRIKDILKKYKEDLVDIYNSDKFNVVKLKNGFDVTKIKKGYRLDQSTGLEEAAENNTLFYEYIKIKPDTDYSVWENKTTNKMEKVDIVRSNLRVCFYDSLKRILKSNSAENVFHSPQDARYARISMNQYFVGYSIFKEGTEKPENIIIPFTEELSLNEKVHIQKVEEAEKKIEENAKNLKSVTLNEEITGIGNIITKPAIEMQVLDFMVRGETKLTHTDATPDKIATLTEFEDLTIRVNEKEYKFLDVNANGRDNVFDEIKSGKIIRRFVSITLDGNESLNHTTLSNGQEAFGLRVGNHRLKPQGIAMCTHYTGAPYYRRNYDIYIPNENWIYVCDNRFKTEEAAKNYYKEQYAKGNPVKIILPIEDELEYSDKIQFKTEKGINTISCNSSRSFSVKYAMDINSALENQKPEKTNDENFKKAIIKVETIRDKKKKLLALENFCQNFSIEEKVSAPVYAVSRTVDAENSQFLFESLDGGETWNEIGKLDVDVANGEAITCIYVEPLEQTLYAIKKAGNRRPKEYELISYDISTPDFRKIGTLDIGKKYAHAASHNFDSAYQNGTYHPYTIFAEYGTGNDEEMYVWKTKNKGATWEKVFTKGARGGNGEIKHFHCVQVDPFTKDIWLASGDTDDEAKIWKSTDEGETWQELFSGSQQTRTLGFVFEKDVIYYGMDSPTKEFPSNIYRIDRNTMQKVSIGVTKNGWAVYNLTRTFIPKGFLVFTEYEKTNGSTPGNKYCMEFYNYDTAKMEVVAEFDISHSEDDYIGIMVAPRYQDMFSGKILLNPTPGLYNQYTGYIKNTYAPMWSLNLNV